MKGIVLSLSIWSVCFLFSTSCLGQSGSTQNANALSEQSACQVLSLEQIASLMGIDEAQIIQEDMSFGKRRSICYFYNKEGNRKFYVKLSWKNDNAQKNKVLEKQYSTYLANGDKEIKSYSEIDHNTDQHIIYGIGQDHGGKYMHVMRKRLSNSAEVQLELTKETKDESAQESLLKIIRNIQ